MKRALGSVMMRVVLGPLVASLQLFGLYVLFHGHYSPGGGFQGGALLAAAVILPMLVHGREGGGYLVVSERAAATLAAAGVLLYVGVGMVSLAVGRPILDYAVLPFPTDVATRRSLGILLVEIGVTLGVMGVLVSIFYSLYGEEASP